MSKVLPTLLDFQESTKNKIKHAFDDLGHKGHYLIGKVGHGKTFVYGQLIYEWIKEGKLKGCPHKVIIITKARAVTKTKRDMERWDLYYPDVWVTSFSQLHAKNAGALYIKEYTEVIRGEPEIMFDWRDELLASVYIIDEGHSLKNHKSLQARQTIALHKKKDIKILCVSATPISRVSEARYFALLSGALIDYGYTNSYNVESAWASFAAQIAGNTDPLQFSEAAMKRLRNVFNPYITRMPNLNPKYKSLNTVKLINFLTQHDELSYHAAYAEYLEKLASIDRDAPGGIAAIWVANLKFRQKAELLRAKIIARAMFESVKAGNAAVAGINFRATCAAIVAELVELGVERKRISLIWGGIKSEEDTYDLDLGPQSEVERQRDIDRFQLGKTDYCIFTYKAGGVALSLHHTNDHDGMEVKKSRPREVYLSVAYSVFEISQGVGRAHRITSLSNTTQTFLLFSNTIEEQVAARLTEKLNSLGAFIQENESWYDILAEGRTNLDASNKQLNDEQLEELEGIDTGVEEQDQLTYEQPKQICDKASGLLEGEESLLVARKSDELTDVC